MPDDVLRYTQRDGIAEIVLDDGKANALSLPVFDAINAALDRALGDGSTALLFAGRPGFFSGGLNVKLLPTLTPEVLSKTLVTFGRTWLRIWTYPLPTAAAVTGHAVAGGALLAFASDRRFVADGAFRIHMNETLIGLPLPTWAMLICESVMPPHVRTEALLHARAYSPTEAHALGMIDGVVAPDVVVDRARESLAALQAVQRPAYAESKVRLRASAVEWASARLVAEMTWSPR